MEHNRIVYEKPYDAEVEYLVVSKGVFIDTGIIGDNNTSIDCGFMRTSGNNFNLIGARYSGLKVNEYSVLPYTNGATSMVFGNKEATLLNSTVITNNTYFRCLTQKTNFKLLDAENNVVLSRVAANNTFQTDGNLVLFGMSTTVGNSNNTNFRVYYFKIYSSDTLVRDLIPVRKGSVGYMYDKVSKKLFGNKGTGNFILGQDVSNPIPNIRRVFRFGNKRFVMPMPYDSKIEYLGTDGNQYIDTGICTCDIGKISSMMRYDSKPSGNIGDGSVISGSFYGLVGMVGKSNTYYYGAQFAGAGKEVASSTTYNDGKFHTLLLDILNRAFTLDNDTPISLEVASTSPELNWYIFKRNTVPRTAVSKRKIIKIWNKSNILVRDFIPVRRGNIGYMYDKVSGKLFGNSGTGQFILGNDIND